MSVVIYCFITHLLLYCSVLNNYNIVFIMLFLEPHNAHLTEMYTIHIIMSYNYVRILNDMNGGT